MTKQGAGSTLSLPTFDPGYTAGWDSKRINPRPHPFVVSDLDHRYPAIRRRRSIAPKALFGKKSPLWRSQHKRYCMNLTSTASILLFRKRRQKFTAFLVESKQMLYTNKCYQKFEFYAINQIRAKSFAELLKHCVNKRQKVTTPVKLQW